MDYQNLRFFFALRKSYARKLQEKHMVFLLFAPNGKFKNIWYKEPDPSVIAVEEPKWSEWE